MSTDTAKLSVATPPTFTDTSLQHYLENLQALAELHPPDGGPT
jgi:hypothetical protein